MKKGVASAMAGVIFVIAALVFVIVLHTQGFTPEERVGQKAIQALSLKEDAVEKLVYYDQALSYASIKAIIDVAESSAVVNQDCGQHLNPVLNDCTEEEVYKYYLAKEMNYYLKDVTPKPLYDFNVKQDITTIVEAKAKEYVKVYAENEFAAATNSAFFRVWPSESTIISSCYGWRTRTDSNIKEFHDGIDIASEGKVLAAAGGTVLSTCVDPNNCNNYQGCTNPCGPWGNNVIIEHANGVYTRYSHMKEIIVEKDMQVRPSQELGIAGNTGNSEGSHLDFKVFLDKDDLTGMDRAKSPLCFFSDEVIQSLDLNAKSCVENYGTNKITANNFPIELARECSTLTIAAGNLDEIPKRARDNSIQYAEIIEQASRDAGIPSSIPKSIFTQETLFDNNLVSTTGAAGIAQFTAKTGASYGLKTTACCTAEEAKAIRPDGRAIGICDLIEPRRCTVENDDRFNPEIAIPKAIELMKTHHGEYNGNIFLIAVAYNAGPSVANKMIEVCGQITESNAVDCAKPSITGISQSKYEGELKPYLQNIAKYYPAWGGDIGVTQLAGSYYEFNPSTYYEVDFDIGTFNKLNTVATTLGSCETEECLQEEINNFNSNTENVERITDYCTEPTPWDEFITSFEECKAYDWEELNVSDCGCDIQWPAIVGTRIQFSGDRIRLLDEDGNFVDEHLTSGINNLYWNGGEIKWANYIYIYTDENTLGSISAYDQRFLGNSPIAHIEIPGENRNIGLPDVMRVEEGWLLRDTVRTCEATNKLRSYCYETKQTVPRLVDNKLVNDLISVPFSIKIQ